MDGQVKLHAILPGLQVNHGLLLCAEHGEMRTVIGGREGEGHSQQRGNIRREDRAMLIDGGQLVCLGWTMGWEETGG